MLKYLHQLWHTKDLRKRILVTIGLLLAYRLLAHLPVPGTDPVALKQFLDTKSNTILGIFAALTGGAVDNFSIALLGLSPYINASIIMQLCSVIFPKLEALSKEGQQGQQTMNRYTRWLSFPLCFIQSYGFLLLLGRGGVNLIDLSFPHVLLPMLFVTAGSVFLMWLGEMITEKGIGNGISMIIFTGIVANIPTNLSAMYLTGSTNGMGPLVFFGIISLGMLIAVVLFTDAHRLIPITYANQGAGRGVQGGLPIRLNQAGMVPIIFAISLITLPSILSQFLQTAPRFQSVKSFIDLYFNAQNPSYPYIIVYFLLVLVFTFFYVSVTFKPVELAESIQKRGGFVPGMRPGKQTADLLSKTSNHLNLWGGTFLGIVAIIPILFTKFSTLGTQNLIISGSGLIIMVGVVMELIRQVNAQMLAHDYDKLV